MKSVLLFLARRLREPSTMLALSALGVVVGLPPGTIDTVGACVAGGAAVLAAVLPDSRG